MSQIEDSIIISRIFIDKSINVINVSGGRKGFGGELCGWRRRETSLVGLKVTTNRLAKFEFGSRLARCEELWIDGG